MSATHPVIGMFVWLLGLCIGSFLNVVIYRLPRGLSIARPAFSFCPLCRASIKWYDNLPLLSWLVLRARCRSCTAAISVQYPLIEATTGLAFVLTYRLLFADAARVGLSAPAFPIDIPLLLAWFALVACMMACSAMDLVSYMVDTRITYVALACGVVLHAAWPRESFLEPTVATPAGAAALAALLVCGLWMWLTVWRKPNEDDPQPESESEEEHDAAPQSGVVVATYLGILAFVALALLLISGAAWQLAAPAAFVALFVATVLAGGQQREADEEIHAAIEEEGPEARGNALRELLWLMPIMAAAAVAYLLVANLPGAAGFWRGAALWPTSPEGFAPLGGVVYAAQGAMIAAAAGWVLRIVFTLAFGREAFGLGDIYILAAAGAATGWDIALLGLLLAVGLAMIGWLLGLLLKRANLIPFGPWLGLGFLAALWLNNTAADIAGKLAADLRFTLEKRPDVLLAMFGVLLVGAVAAVVFARIVRRWIEPRPS